MKVDVSLGGIRFEHRLVEAASIRFHLVEGGSGHPVVLMAGFPQSCYAWRRVLPILAARFHVVVLDLPGQGDTDKPIDGYDTRTTSQRVNALIKALAIERHFIVGHDIGSWVAYPYAHQFAAQLVGVVLLDANIPGVTLRPTLALGPENWRNWHFLFNSIPDLPEALLGGRERILIEWFFNRKTADAVATFNRADIDEYERAYQTLGGLRGMLGYYRAVLEDMKQNESLIGHKLKVPILALGGEVGSAPDIYQSVVPLGEDVRGGVIASSGHYIPEEQPESLAAEMMAFFDSVETWRKSPATHAVVSAIGSPKPCRYTCPPG
jgi:pimeloyl-ACP methyl ester carboxylesterase